MKKQKSACPGKHRYLAGKRILPPPITAKTDIVKLIDSLDAYNGGRLRAACQLLREKYSRPDRKVHSMSTLKTYVQGCATNLSLSWFEDEVDAVAAYMNKEFYKFQFFFAACHINTLTHFTFHQSILH